MNIDDLYRDVKIMMDFYENENDSKDSFVSKYIRNIAEEQYRNKSIGGLKEVYAILQEVRPFMKEDAKERLEKLLSDSNR